MHAVRYLLVVLTTLSLAGGASFTQSSFVFVDEELPTINATEQISEAFTLNDTDGEVMVDWIVVGPFWYAAAAASSQQFAPKSGAVAMNQSTASPDWQVEVDVLDEYTGMVWADRLYIEEYANLHAATTSRIRKGWLNTDITPPGNFPGTPCLGADWQFDFQNVTDYGGYSFRCGIWMTNQGQNPLNGATLLAEIFGENGILGGLPDAGLVDSNGNVILPGGWEIRNYGGTQPGIYYSENMDAFTWVDRFPQIQPGTVLWLMGPRGPNGLPTPHAIFTTEHYMNESAGYGGAQVNHGLGFYKFAPSLLSSWDGAGAGG